MRLLALISSLIALLFGIGSLPPEWEDYEVLPSATPIDTLPPTVYAPATSSTTVPATATTPAATAPATTTTATAPADIPEGGLCSEWWPTARSMGWPDELLPTLGQVMWNESRCQPDVISPTKDYGLVQINWAAHGDTVTALGYTREHLLVPAVNLLIGRLVYQQAVDAGRACGFQPWYMSGDYCN